MNVPQYVMYVKDYWFARDISNHKYQYQCLSYYFSVICDVCPQYVTGVSVRIKTLIPHLSIKTSRVQQKESAYGLHLCVCGSTAPFSHPRATFVHLSQRTAQLENRDKPHRIKYKEKKIFFWTFLSYKSITHSEINDLLSKIIQLSKKYSVCV